MPPSQALPWQLGIASILLTLLALIVEGVPSIQWTPQLKLIVLYQAGLATGTAFWAQIVVLRNLSAVSTNLSMMGIPVIGVVSSIIVLDEQITFALTLGMALCYHRRVNQHIVGPPNGRRPHTEQDLTLCMIMRWNRSG